MRCAYCGRPYEEDQPACLSCGLPRGQSAPEDAPDRLGLVAIIGFNAFLLAFLLPFIKVVCGAAGPAALTGLGILRSFLDPGAPAGACSAGAPALLVGAAALAGLVGLLVSVLSIDAAGTAAGTALAVFAFASTGLAGAWPWLPSLDDGAPALNAAPAIGFWAALVLAAGLAAVHLLARHRSLAGPAAGTAAKRASKSTAMAAAGGVGGAVVLAVVALLLRPAVDRQDLGRGGAPAAASASVATPIPTAAPSPLPAATAQATPVPARTPTAKATPAPSHHSSGSHGAKKHAESQPATNPKAERWAALGGSLAQNGRTSDAIVAYQKALDYDPDNRVACRGLVDAYTATGDLVEALKYKKRLNR